jgi:hypothetical protein
MPWTRYVMSVLFGFIVLIWFFVLAYRKEPLH